MREHKDRGQCLTGELLFDAASGIELPREAREHLEQCADCREAVAKAQRKLVSMRSEMDAVVDEAVSGFHLPPLPAREATKSREPRTVWQWIASPVPAYALAAAILIALVPVFLLRQPAGLELGAPRSSQVGDWKDIASGVSSGELLDALYSVDTQDASDIRAKITLLDEYSRTHPEDASIHVKLVSLYEALLALDDWEDALLTRARVETRLAEERDIVREMIGSELGPGRTAPGDGQ